MKFVDKYMPNIEDYLGFGEDLYFVSSHYLIVIDRYTKVQYDERDVVG